MPEEATPEQLKRMYPVLIENALDQMDLARAGFNLTDAEGQAAIVDNCARLEALVSKAGLANRTDDVTEMRKLLPELLAVA